MSNRPSVGVQLLCQSSWLHTTHLCFLSSFKSPRLALCSTGTLDRLQMSAGRYAPPFAIQHTPCSIAVKPGILGPTCQKTEEASASYLLGLVELGAKLVQVCSSRLYALLNCSQLLLQLSQVPLHIPARQPVPFMCYNIVSLRLPVRPASHVQGETAETPGLILETGWAQLQPQEHPLQCSRPERLTMYKRILKISLAQARIRWVWVPEGVLTVTPCIRPPGHDIVHITDGAVTEEGFVGCAQHPQSVALSLRHHKTLSNRHSWL